jgi:hypothetical protein
MRLFRIIILRGIYSLLTLGTVIGTLAENASKKKKYVHVVLVCVVTADSFKAITYRSATQSSLACCNHPCPVTPAFPWSAR